MHEHAVDQLAALGVIGGKAPGVFDPGATITRGQLAAVLVRVVELLTGETVPEPVDHFADDDGDAHERAINEAFELGLISGRADGTFGPGEPVRRDQAAMLLIRMLDALHT